jgi:hypothetical protein
MRFTPRYRWFGVLIGVYLHLPYTRHYTRHRESRALCARRALQVDLRNAIDADQPITRPSMVEMPTIGTAIIAPWSWHRRSRARRMLQRVPTFSARKNGRRGAPSRSKSEPTPRPGLQAAVTYPAFEAKAFLMLRCANHGHVTVPQRSPVRYSGRVSRAGDCRMEAVTQDGFPRLPVFSNVRGTDTMSALRTLGSLG